MSLTISEATPLSLHKPRPFPHKPRPPHPDTVICTGCCSTLDNIITQVFKRIARIKKHPTAAIEPDNLLNAIDLNQELMHGVSLMTATSYLAYADNSLIHPRRWCGQ